MLNKIKQRKQEGFTIIEVMIVLAIAGLIMIVVFLAVPALQRNSRNTALNTSANNIVSAVGDFVADNNGALPTGPTTATAPASNQVAITGAAGSTPKRADVSSNSVVTFVVGGTALTNSAAVGTVQLITGTTAVCNATGNGISGTGSARNYVVLYVAEGSNGNALKCIGN